jgi:hypothetical protein
VFNYTRWEDLFGDQVSKIREARTGRPQLLYDVEIESIPDMEDALRQCWIERVKPKDAAKRYQRLGWEIA